MTIKKKRKEQMGSTVFKAAALYPRYRALKFLTTEEKDNVWKELEQEIGIQASMNNTNQETTISDTKNEAEPPTKKIIVRR
jgi:hypothetical protein